MKSKTIVLLIVIAIIITAIIYLQATSDEISQQEINELGANAEIRVEDLIETTHNTTQGRVIADVERESIDAKANKYERAKELVDPEGYINVDTITITEHIRKNVILVDFWTYSCVNCQRTLPYLTTWYEKYKDEGLIIIGVHTPEFDFEKEYDNVKKATEKWNVTYPVVQDNDRETWYAYNNRYWPRKYLIDIDGFIVYDHIGEGAYEETEKKIQELLKERSAVLNEAVAINTDIVTIASDKSGSAGLTPEIYFGWSFHRDQIGNQGGWREGETTAYSFPKEKTKNRFYVNGTWISNPQDMKLTSTEGWVYLNYTAKNVNIVAHAPEPTQLDIYVDGKKVDEITIHDPDLYRIISMDAVGNHILELKVNKDTTLNTFTFG